MVKPKKHLGQHFLKNDGICHRIAASLTRHGDYEKVLEIGPGMGALTQHLLKREELHVAVIEIDKESVAYLNDHYPQLHGNIIDGDFLKIDWSEKTDEPFAVIGNFPYNISSQILFKVHEYRNLVPEVVGMFQKEVAERVAAGPGSKTYGILSVLLQAYYDIEYLFTVDEHEFNPPPKVKSGVIRLRRNDVDDIGCDEKEFVRVVKQAFNQRRKMLRSSLKSLLNDQAREVLDDLLHLRPEQLSVAQFVRITKAVSA